jgi:hypothetical protein
MAAVGCCCQVYAGVVYAVTDTNEARAAQDTRHAATAPPCVRCEWRQQKKAGTARWMILLMSSAMRTEPQCTNNCHVQSTSMDLSFFRLRVSRRILNALPIVLLSDTVST